MATSEERETVERFSERYRVGPTAVTRQIELAVIGGDWGANGYTTVAQADRLAVVLRLGPGVRLLDVGAGRGWPGLYLTASTGCRVVLSDLPAEAVTAAASRARHEGLARQAVAIVASARHLPFPPASFDAVVHADVLCWLRPKLSVLRASRQLLRPGGRTAFFTIYPAPGLDAGQRRRASRDGPSAVATARTHTELLDSAGFTDINETDYTAEFGDITPSWIEQWDRHHDELASLLGAQAVADRQTERRVQRRAIDDGILRRALFSARRP